MGAPFRCTPEPNVPSEWTAVGQTESDAVRELARCLREIGEGRVPQ